MYVHTHTYIYIYTLTNGFQVHWRWILTDMLKGIFTIFQKKGMLRMPACPWPWHLKSLKLVMWLLQIGKLCWKLCYSYVRCFFICWSWINLMEKRKYHFCWSTRWTSWGKVPATEGHIVDLTQSTPWRTLLRSAPSMCLLWFTRLGPTVKRVSCALNLSPQSIDNPWF